MTVRVCFRWLFPDLLVFLKELIFCRALTRYFHFSFSECFAVTWSSHKPKFSFYWCKMWPLWSQLNTAPPPPPPPPPGAPCGGGGSFLSPSGMCGNVFVLWQRGWPGQTPVPPHHVDTWNPFLDVTSGLVKDPADVLDRQKCLDALAALRHAKWFQVRNIILLSSCSLMTMMMWFLWSLFCSLLYFCSTFGFHGPRWEKKNKKNIFKFKDATLKKKSNWIPTAIQSWKILNQTVFFCTLAASSWSFLFNGILK